MNPEIERKILASLKKYDQIELAIVFGSIAMGTEKKESDLDIAVLSKTPIDVDLKIELIGTLAEHTGRAIDLIDLKEAGQPLLGQILSKGKRIFGSDTQYAQLMMRNIMDRTDFLPYRDRILEERKQAWIGA